MDFVCPSDPAVWDYDGRRFGPCFADLWLYGAGVRRECDRHGCCARALPRQEEHSQSSVEGSKNQIGGNATCMSENSELVARKQGAHMADVKLEPALDGCEIGPSESQGNSTHAEGSVPSLGVKNELTDCELPALCEKVSFSSRQRRKRKTSYSTEKTLEEDAYTVEEGVAYRSRRRRKKTATDSIEKALDEDAPGLLQILLNRGIVVEEIKLYGAEEDNELIADSTESNFEDLENVIANV